MQARNLVLMGVVALAACSGGGSDDGGGYCVGSFDGGDTGFGCTNCSGVDPFEDNSLPEAIDNKGGTYRGVGLDPSGAITIRIEAPGGMSFPAGVDAGAKLRFPTGVEITATYSLYNNDSPVAATSGSTISSGGSPAGAGSDNYYAVVPAGTIDRIDLALSVAGSIEREHFRIYEFCGDR